MSEASGASDRESRTASDTTDERTVNQRDALVNPTRVQARKTPPKAAADRTGVLNAAGVRSSQLYHIDER